MIRHYYSLNELIDVEITNGFKQLFDNWGYTYTDDTKSKELWNDIINNYGDDYIIYIDLTTFNKPSITDIKNDPDLSKEFMYFIRKIYSWLGDSKYRYETIIDFFDNNKSKLLDKVETITTSQFNDTPQSTTTTPLYDETFATTYTKGTSSSDVTTLINRLNEIRGTLTSIYDEWCKDFGKKFVMYI